MNSVQNSEPLVWVPFEVDKKFDGLRVDRFLAQRLTGYSRSQVQKMLEDCRITREGRVVRASAKVHTSEKILIAYSRRPEEPLTPETSLPILFEDDHLLIVNKPSGLLSHPTDKVVDHTVLGYLRHTRPDLGKVHLLHRLDRDTSGVLALAKTVTASRRWTRLMSDHRIQKEYLALVRGTPKPSKGTINRPIGRQGGTVRVRQWVDVPAAVSAITEYEVLRPGPVSLVRAFPKTGRLHQIRVHFAALGHPLLGDALYTGTGELYLKMVEGNFTEKDRQSLGFPRVALHAAALNFEHPMTGKSVLVNAFVPRDMEDFLHEIRDGASPIVTCTVRSGEVWI